MKRIFLNYYFKLKRRLDLFNQYHQLDYLAFCYGPAVTFQPRVLVGMDFRLTMLSPTSRLTVGAGCTFRNNNTITLDNGNLTIGENNFFNNGCSLNCLATTTIGDGNLFGENVKFYDHNHHFADLDKPIGDQGFSLGNITIGTNCWIGSNNIILKGVTIGDNVVIGANNVIHKSIPSNTLVKATAPSQITPRTPRPAATQAQES